MGSAQSQQASQDEIPREAVTWHPLELEEHPIDVTPKIKGIVVGAGITGINAAILLPVKVPGIDLVIYERNAEVVSSFDNDQHCRYDANLIGGRGLASMYLSRSPMRCSISCLPIDIFPFARLVGALC